MKPSLRTTPASRARAAPAAEQDRPDVADQREAWFDGQPDLASERLVFIDERGTSTKMAGGAVVPPAQIGRRRSGLLSFLQGSR